MWLGEPARPAVTDTQSFFHCSRDVSGSMNRFEGISLVTARILAWLHLPATEYNLARLAFNENLHEREGCLYTVPWGLQGSACCAGAIWYTKAGVALKQP